jgi:Tol biopolymer transport system component
MISSIIAIRTALVLFAYLLICSRLFPAAPAKAQSPDSPPVATATRQIDIEDARMIALSPDGRLLAAADFNQDHLCVYDVSTLVEQSCADLSILDAGLRLEDVVWSPDSTRLAFSERTFVYFLDGDLWVMDAQTGAITDITDDNYTGSVISFDESADKSAFNLDLDVAPAWTPDSQSITYSRTVIRRGERLGNEIAQVPATGGDPRTLVQVSPTEMGIVYFGTEWSPDGSTFYYTVSHVDAEAPDNVIWAYDAVTGQTRQIATSEPDLGPLALLQVSPAGDRLLGYYPQAYAQFAAEGTQLRLIDVASGDVVIPDMPVPDATDFASIRLAIFSPDGEYLLEITRQTNPDWQVWTTEIDSGRHTRLLPTLPGASVMDFGLTPTWTASGTLFVAGHIGHGYLVTVEGGNAPIAGTPVATPAAPPSATPIAETAVVSAELAAIHSAPSDQAPTVLVLPAGVSVEIIGDEVSGEGVTWLPVRDPATRTIGYLRADQLETTPDNS